MRTSRARTAAVLLLAGLLAGCSSGGAESASSDGGATAGEAAEPAPADAVGGGEESGAGDDLGTAVPGVSQRQFVTTGSISMTVEDPREAAADAAALVERAGGFVQGRDISAGTPEEPASARLTVRIPSTEVNGTLDDLEELGTVDDVEESSVEVTDQVRDLDARVRTLEMSITRLESLLADATTVPEILEAERILTERQSELEVLLSQQAALDQDVALATFELYLWTPGQAPEVVEEPEGFLPSLRAGWESLLATLGVIVQVVAVLLPWAVFLGLIAWGVLAVRRWVRRHRPARPAVPAPATASWPTPGPPSPPVPVGAGAGAAPAARTPSGDDAAGRTEQAPPA